MITVGLIPARGGSKAIPRKNLAPVAGKPLIAWTIEAALGSASLDRVLVSTDDAEIAGVARDFGADVPFMRPSEFAQDNSGSLEVVLHALDWLSEHDGVAPDYVLLLQPTSLFRTTADIDGAIYFAAQRAADAVIGVCEASPHPYITRRLGPGGELSDFIDCEKPVRRQDYPSAYVVNGAIYLNRPASLRTTRSFQPPGTLAYVMPSERSLDIDTPWDLKIADLILRHARD